MTNKVLKKYIYQGFGFPVVLLNFPAKKIRGEWVPLINFVELANHVLSVLCFIQQPLTGNQIFLFEMRLD